MGGLSASHKYFVKEQKTMASTNKTPHLGLCQWVETDPFLMDDMNDTLEKIDAAIEERGRKKLFDVTVTEAVPAVDLDFTDIDLAPYGELEIFIDLSTVNVAMRVNGVADSAYSNSTALASNLESKIPVGSGICGIVLLRDAFKYYRVGDYYTSRMDKRKFLRLDTINYFTTTGSNFLVGDRFSVWGVRK